MSWNREGTICTCANGDRYYRHPGSGTMALLGQPDPAPSLGSLRRVQFTHDGPTIEKPAKAARASKARDEKTLELFK